MLKSFQYLMVVFFSVNLISISGLAMDSKVGFVDMQKAIKSTAAGKKAKEKLDADFNKRKESLDKKKADIEKIGQDLEKKKAVLSEEVLSKKQMELQEDMMRFQKEVAESQLEISKKEKELVDPIIEKLKKAIEKVAAEKSFTLVLDKTAQNVLFSVAEVDLTADVVAAFEKEK